MNSVSNESTYFRTYGNTSGAKALFVYAEPRGSWLTAFHARDWTVPWAADWEIPNLMPDDGTEHKAIYDLIGSTLLPAFTARAREVLEPFLPVRSEWLGFRYQDTIYWGLHVFEIVHVDKMVPSRSTGLRKSGTQLIEYTTLHLQEDARFPIPDIVSLDPSRCRHVHVSPRVRAAVERANLTGFIFDSPMTVEWALQ
jgi:hypothetical protein